MPDKGAYPDLLSYTRFLEVMPKALVPLSSYFSTLQGESTGIEFIDSTSINVCHNLRIPRHKTFKGMVLLTAQKEFKQQKNANTKIEISSQHRAFEFASQ